jgi:hypothetical protein
MREGWREGGPCFLTISKLENASNSATKPTGLSPCVYCLMLLKKSNLQHMMKVRAVAQSKQRRRERRQQTWRQLNTSSTELSAIMRKRGEALRGCEARRFDGRGRWRDVIIEVVRGHSRPRFERSRIGKSMSAWRGCCCSRWSEGCCSRWSEGCCSRWSCEQLRRRGLGVESCFGSIWRKHEGITRAIATYSIEFAPKQHKMHQLCSNIITKITPTW